MSLTGDLVGSLLKGFYREKKAGSKYRRGAAEPGALVQPPPVSRLLGAFLPQGGA